MPIPFRTKLALDQQARIDSGKIASLDGSIAVGETFFINGVQIDVTNSTANDILTYDVLNNKYRPISGSPNSTPLLGENRVISGMEITPVSGDNLTFNVANGIYLISGQSSTFSGNTAAVSSGDSSYIRYDILYVSGSPNQHIVYTLEGSPSANPIIPLVPVGTVGLAIIEVMPGTTSLSGTSSIYSMNAIFAGQVIYNRGSFTNIENFLDGNYVYPKINTFTNDINELEFGSTANTVSFSWETNKTGKDRTLNPTGTTFNVFQTSYILTGQTITGDVFTSASAFTLTFYDGINTANSQTEIKFYNKIYFGNFSGLTINSVEILSVLSTNYLMTQKLENSSVVDGDGNYLYVCYPSRFGALRVYVNGLYLNSFVSDTISFTNINGITENYITLRSNYIQNGTDIEIKLVS